MASLTVIEGPDRGKRYEIADGRLTLGRDTGNTARVHDTEASRHHAEVRQVDDDFYVRDLRSSNGTFLNAKRVDQSILKTGDRIRIGGTEMLFNAGVARSAVDLAERINMVGPGQQQPPDSSAIISVIKQSEGSQYLRFPERAGSQWLQDALGNLRVMYETSQAISQISDIDQLLDHIMDLMVKSIRPDRGCIVLRDQTTGALKATAVHFAQSIPGDDQNITLSNTIVDWVLKRGEGILILDASQDRRFSSSQSVVQLGIREAICVPMTGRHETFGVIYVDTTADRRRLLQTQQTTKFTEEHLKLMLAIAYQAGLAIE
ncbi:MAG: FHA domain-containing protein, partial [Planctomycetia bacterium]